MLPTKPETFVVWTDPALGFGSGASKSMPLHFHFDSLTASSNDLPVGIRTMINALKVLDHAEAQHYKEEWEALIPAYDAAIVDDPEEFDNHPVYNAALELERQLMAEINSHLPSYAVLQFTDKHTLSYCYVEPMTAEMAAEMLYYEINRIPALPWSEVSLTVREHYIATARRQAEQPSIPEVQGKKKRLLRNKPNVTKQGGREDGQAPLPLKKR